MMTLLSPHLDDAVLSLGQWIAAGYPGGEGPLEVHSVLAGVPLAGTWSEYDASCGWESSVTAMECRRREDIDAIEFLGARWVHWQFLDQQYRSDRAIDAPQITDQIEGLYSPRELMLAPLGLGHPDHRLVADCALEAIRRHAGARPVGLLMYEELPYRVLNPEQVVERLELVRGEGWDIDPLPWPLEQGDKLHREVKAGAIRCYRSQFPEGAEDTCVLVPERVWRITR